MKYFFTFISIFLLFLGGCSTKNNVNKTPNNIILNDIWALEKIDTKTIQIKTIKPIQIEFNTQEKKFYGNDGCNSIFGNISKLNENRLTFDSTASTKMACPNMEFSNVYLQLLHKTHFYKIESSRLYLFDENKKLLLEYKKVD